MSTALAASGQPVFWPRSIGRLLLAREADIAPEVLPGGN